MALTTLGRAAADLGIEFPDNFNVTGFKKAGVNARELMQQIAEAVGNDPNNSLTEEGIVAEFEAAHDKGRAKTPAAKESGAFKKVFGTPPAAADKKGASVVEPESTTSDTPNNLQDASIDTGEVGDLPAEQQGMAQSDMPALNLEGLDPEAVGEVREAAQQSVEAEGGAVDPEDNFNISPEKAALLTEAHRNSEVGVRRPEDVERNYYGETAFEAFQRLMPDRVDGFLNMFDEGGMADTPFIANNPELSQAIKDNYQKMSFDELDEQLMMAYEDLENSHNSPEHNYTLIGYSEEPGPGRMSPPEEMGGEKKFVDTLPEALPDSELQKTTTDDPLNVLSGGVRPDGTTSGINLSQDADQLGRTTGSPEGDFADTVNVGEDGLTEAINGILGERQTPEQMQAAFANIAQGFGGAATPNATAGGASQTSKSSSSGTPTPAQPNNAQTAATLQQQPAPTAQTMGTLQQGISPTQSANLQQTFGVQPTASQQAAPTGMSAKQLAGLQATFGVNQPNSTSGGGGGQAAGGGGGGPPDPTETAVEFYDPASDYPFTTGNYKRAARASEVPYDPVRSNQGGEKSPKGPPVPPKNVSMGGADYITRPLDTAYQNRVPLTGAGGAATLIRLLQGGGEEAQDQSLPTQADVGQYYQQQQGVEEAPMRVRRNLGQDIQDIFNDY